MAAADFPIYFTVSANSTQAIASFQSLNGEMDKVVAKTEVDSVVRFDWP